MLRVMLAKEMGRGGMTEDEYKELVTRMQDNVGDVVSQCQREQEEEEEVQTSQWRFQDFPRGANPKGGDDSLLFGQIFLKTVWKLCQEVGAPPKFVYVDPPLQFKWV